MLSFFADMSPITLWTLLVLLLLSVVIPYFWCRYLCPYGALLGSLSWLSVFKIHRNEESCIDCEKCTMACPSRIKIHPAKTVISDECHSCLQCVDSCPVKDTLYLSVTGRRARMRRPAYAVIIIMLFLIGTAIARLAGYWHNQISPGEYLHHITRLEEPDYYHNRGQVPDHEEGTGRNHHPTK